MRDDDDLVPPRWRSLFNNQDWLLHDIVVKSFWAFGFIAAIAHTAVWIWRPWISNIGL